jgi:branched-chain amino acid transport system ATP-binding protein
MTEPQLAFEDVEVAYGRTPILRDLSLTVESGDLVALIGRNGVGKTTLMKTAIGLLSPRNGRITYQGEDVTDQTADERARLGIGYVPQGRDVFPRMTVEENLRMGETVNDRTEETHYEEVYEFFPRLANRKQQNAGTMSGGEQQMLAIGRALIGSPDLLLLDEPSEGVQPNIVTQIGETLRDINEELGTTIFFVEQNLEFTATTSDYCYVMEKGTVVDDVRSEELEDSEIVQKYIAI